jgi:hypothetical protein
MDIRRAYIRRSVKQARLQKRLAVAAMLTVACCAAFLLRPEPQPVQDFLTAAVSDGPVPSSAAILRVAAHPAQAAARRVYPYSIVPGGVSGRAELAHAVLADRTVAAHYAGFAVDKASLQTAGKTRAVYVSYRKGDQVYWTARPVTLAEGEAVLSDGQNDIRARCGNRISDTPRLPVEARGPGEQELDTPVVQGQDGGALLQTASALDEEIGSGEAFALQSFPNGAGLLTPAQTAASPVQTGFGNSSLGLGGLGSLIDSSRRGTLLASLSSPASGLGSSTTDGAAANSDPAPAGSSLSYGSDSGGSGKGGDPALPGSLSDTAGGTGGTSSGTGGATGGATGGTGGTTGDTGGTAGTSGGTSGGTTGGGKPAGGDTPKPPSPTLQTNPAPDGKTPPRTHELPEPGSVWLTGVAAAALLLHRRLRPRKPR